jgi:adenosylcobinamide-phosphate synthase
LDDLLNFLPARLGIPMISLAALLCRLDARQAWRIGWRDRLQHSSPNAGHTEAAVAGALHVKLNGPGIYPFGKVDKPWLGDGMEQVTARHLQRTFYLIVTAALIATVFFSIIMALL